MSRAVRNAADPDLGVLAGRLLFAIQSELFSRLHHLGFDDIKPRHGAVLAYLQPEGIRATELARMSGQHKQVVGTLVDELTALGYVERRSDPADRRAKLVCPTDKGRTQMAAADQIMADMQARHAQRLGAEVYDEFKRVFADVVEHQRHGS
ncbi:DNA-binding MarR family transcriptional regulator [Streptomyces sp. SAI-208]|nr:DNA-binding MarR family transcriptional regulator [Streptomyces sp. SAI-090]MDH6554102.1 DNA-binding MarR family transcriptional regulator [Streptomyces sp. SAI-041]MDH6573179.1 DNA-binding MarR family transcriptional regulator [Streptomyces sp. SAI-117]MDH6612871.1 DNA-binding MarR family transcriptional regulator [Streptomyces sp. SAI-208]MDH6614086.1 DNA-binding MarR family transcriptional regulator [Streptomyces sp. SAI-135]